MTESCPLPACFHHADSKALLVDHLTDDHDIFTALVNGELQVRETARRATVTDGGWE